MPSERGGNITYHGPGQVVGYPVIDLHRARLGVEEYVSLLESLMMDVASHWGVPAVRDSRNRGVWVGGAKAGSIGLCLRHGMAFHGFALNVNIDLTPFEWINPCGMAGIPMTSLQRAAGVEIPMNDLRQTVWRTSSRLFDVHFKPITLADLQALLANHTAAAKES